MFHALRLSSLALPARVASGVDQAALPRVGWVDSAKGIGILLVVIGHAIDGLIGSGIRPESNWFRPTLLTIYLFHMPLFFVLSGLFFPQRVQKGAFVFGRRAVTGLVGPYLLWGAIQTVAVHAAATYVNTPPGDLTGALSAMLLEAPPAQFWFLYVLLLAQLLAMILLPILGASGFLVLAVLLPVVSPHPLPIVLSLGVKMLPFFALGCLLGDRGWLRVPSRLSTSRAAQVLLGTGVIVFGTAAWLAASAGMLDRPDFRGDAVIRLAWTPEAVPAALAGTAAVIVIAARCSGIVGAVLTYLGRLSMPIYLLHILFLAGMRILLVKVAGWSDPAMLLLLTAAGVVGPLAVAWIAERLGVARLLALQS